MPPAHVVVDPASDGTGSHDLIALLGLSTIFVRREGVGKKIERLYSSTVQK